MSLGQTINYFALLKKTVKPKEKKEKEKEKEFLFLFPTHENIGTKAFMQFFLLVNSFYAVGST